MTALICNLCFHCRIKEDEIVCLEQDQAKFKIFLKNYNADSKCKMFLNCENIELRNLHLKKNKRVH